MSWLVLVSILFAGCTFAVYSDDGKPEKGGQPTSPRPPTSADFITIFLCGDVMTGRGIDQIMPEPGDPALHEPWVRDAREYVRIAERVNGTIQKPVGFSYIWGDALRELEIRAPDVRIVNLETSVTESDDYWPEKSIHYKMHPQNVPCLSAAEIDVCSLANNHVLDWGYSGLTETLATLEKANIKTAGAGRSRKEAEEPAILEIGDRGRVIVFSFGSATAGVPESWAAADERPGVDLLEGFGDDCVHGIKERIRRVKKENDIVVVSIHWGTNWGYGIPTEQTDLAHRLIDTAGVDIVHGHSSHHIRPIEVYNGRLILYGCGDFLNDYEGINGYEGFRSDLTLMYFARIAPKSGKLISMKMVPLQIKKFRLSRASNADTYWLRDTLNRINKTFGTGVALSEDDALILEW